MDERTKNLTVRKPAGCFPGAAAVLLLFCMAFAGCDSPAGADADGGRISLVSPAPEAGAAQDRG